MEVFDAGFNLIIGLLNFIIGKGNGDTYIHLDINSSL